MLIFAAGVLVGTGPATVALLAGTDRFSGFTELSLTDPSIASYGAPAGSEVSVSVGNYDTGSRRYEWEARLEDSQEIFDSGYLTLAPGRRAEVVLTMPEASTGWASFAVIGLSHSLRWRLVASPDTTSSDSTSSDSTSPDSTSPDSRTTSSTIRPPRPDSLLNSTDPTSPVEPSTVPPDDYPDNMVGNSGPVEPVSGEDLAAGGELPRGGQDYLSPPSADSGLLDSSPDNLTTPSPSITPPRPYVRIDSMDPLRPEPVWVSFSSSEMVFFAPHRAGISQEEMTKIAALVAALKPGRNFQVSCEGFTQYGSSHGADMRLSQRRADAVCAAVAALKPDAEFFPVGKGRAGFSGDGARFVALKVSYEVKEHPGAASTIPAHM